MYSGEARINPKIEDLRAAGPDATGSPATFTQSGIGAKLVASFTVSDLATLLTPSEFVKANVIGEATPAYTATSQSEISTAPTTIPLSTGGSAPFSVGRVSAAEGSLITGINARIVSSGDVGLELLASATLPAAGVPAETPALYVSPSAAFAAEATNPQSPSDINTAQSQSISSSGVPSAVVASITGINAAERGFATISTL